MIYSDWIDIFVINLRLTVRCSSWFAEADLGTALEFIESSFKRVETSAHGLGGGDAPDRVQADFDAPAP